jgi:hypothetical protein
MILIAILLRRAARTSATFGTKSRFAAAKENATRKCRDEGRPQLFFAARAITAILSAKFTWLSSWGT